MLELGKYLRLKDFRHVWVIEITDREDDFPLLRVRRPCGAFYATRTITAKGFLARHKKVNDSGKA